MVCLLYIDQSEGQGRQLATLPSTATKIFEVHLLQKIKMSEENLLRIIDSNRKTKASEHPEETSKNSDICDFSKVSDIGNKW